MRKMIWFQGKSILYPDLSYIQLSYKQFVLYVHLHSFSIQAILLPNIAAEYISVRAAAGLMSHVLLPSLFRPLCLKGRGREDSLTCRNFHISPLLFLSQPVSQSLRISPFPLPLCPNDGEIYFLH